jgi:hypothetical protein
MLEALADLAAQLGIGGLECLRPGGERSTKPAAILGQTRRVAPRLPLTDQIGPATRSNRLDSGRWEFQLARE